MLVHARVCVCWGGGVGRESGERVCVCKCVRAETNRL